MGLSVIHFGIDTCNRMPVFVNAGYSVGFCREISELEARIKTPPPAAALVIDELKERDILSVLRVVRSWPSPPPIVVFEESYTSGLERLNIDLIVPPLTPPEEWLRQVAALIERSRAILQASAALSEESALLRVESQAVRAEATITRERFVQTRDKFSISKNGKKSR